MQIAMVSLSDTCSLFLLNVLQDFSEGVQGATSKDVMDLLLLTQYL